MPGPTPVPRPAFLSQTSATRRQREPSFPTLQTRGSSTLLSPNLATTAAAATGAWGTQPLPTTDAPAATTTLARKKGHGPSLSLGPAVQDADKNGTAIHPLKHTWEVWFSNRSGAKQGHKEEKSGKEKESREEWETGVVKLGFFSSIESLHPFLAHLTPPSELPASLSSTHHLFNPSSPAPGTSHLISDLNIFRAPVAPAWEDPHNTGGGRWVLRLRKGVADRVWEEVVWALVGERLERGTNDEDVDGGASGSSKVCRVNGVVLSVRKDEDILSVWVAPSSRSERDYVRDSLRTALEPILSPAAISNLILDYKPHPVSASHNSTTAASSQASGGANGGGHERHGERHGERHHSHHGHRGERKENGTAGGENGGERTGHARDRTGEGRRNGGVGGGFGNYRNASGDGEGATTRSGADGLDSHPPRRERKEPGPLTWGRS